MKPWPLLLGSNRDERLDRAFDVPAAWWPDEPGIVAWRDRLSGGSWLGVNAHGVVSFFFNAALLALTVNIAASAI